MTARITSQGRVGGRMWGYSIQADSEPYIGRIDQIWVVRDASAGVCKVLRYYPSGNMPCGMDSDPNVADRIARSRAEDIAKMFSK